jgi:hypothetical protein
MNAESLRQLIANCRRSDRRALGFPRDWQPERVHNPEIDGFFLTHAGAWELIASNLEHGHPFTEMELDNPPGAPAIVLKIALDPRHPAVYVKLQIGKQNVPIGRSFHYSDKYERNRFAQDANVRRR